MATHKSAVKRARQALRRRARNRQVRSRMRSAVKAVREALTTDRRDEATQSLRLAEGILRKAASQGVIPKRRASRQVARLTRAVKP